MQYVKIVLGEKVYEEMWVVMLKLFFKYLCEKGWFDICIIVMDECLMEVMQKILQVICKVDFEFKVLLVGNFYKELEVDIYDYCIFIGVFYLVEVLVCCV